MAAGGMSKVAQCRLLAALSLALSILITCCCCSRAVTSSADVILLLAAGTALYHTS